jgi:hypothetical protein
MEAMRAPDPEDVDTNRDLLSSAVGDRCSNCQAPLASDQRYCVNCGQRRGKARFAFDTSVAPTAATGETAQRPARRKPRAPAGATLVAAVATLLLAMGVGVLIGHDSNTRTQSVAASPPVHVTVGGGGAGTAAAANTGDGSRASKSKHKSSKSSSSSAAAAKSVSKATAAKAAAAASKVLGSSAPKNPTVQPGQAATGAGTQNGKFTGHFFGQ